MLKGERRRMKRALIPISLASILTGLLFLSFVPLAACQQTTVYVDPSITTVKWGSEFTVDINIADVTDLRGWAVVLEFNPDLLKCLSVDEGPFLQSAGPTNWTVSIKNSVGEIVATCELSPWTPEGADGSGTLAHVTFRCELPGDTPLHFSSCWLWADGGWKWPNLVDGYVKQAPPPVGGKIAPIIIPTGKSESLVPWIGLASLTTLAAVALVSVRYIKKKQN